MFSQKIKDLRKKAGLTQQQLAEKLFVEQTTVSSWERGKAYPDTLRLQSIADFFKIGVDELLERESSSYQNNITGDNSVIIGQAHEPITIKNGQERTLTTQERDLLHVYNMADGKQQMRIMNLIYEIEEELNSKEGAIDEKS